MGIPSWWGLWTRHGRLVGVYDDHEYVPPTGARPGVIGFTQTLAREVAAHRITVNAVCPGTVETDMIDRIRADRARYESRGVVMSVEPIPLGRTVAPTEVAAVVGFLLSADADYITGQAINVDGGRVMH
jgi:NAD(P)-dependent dehydrogenase (short-subunit alcohol dehydrogenase family)